MYWLKFGTRTKFKRSNFCMYLVLKSGNFQGNYLSLLPNWSSSFRIKLCICKPVDLQPLLSFQPDIYFWWYFKQKTYSHASLTAKSQYHYSNDWSDWVISPSESGHGQLPDPDESHHHFHHHDYGQLFCCYYH